MEEVLKHDHLLSLIDLQPKYPQYEDEYDDNDELIIKQDFRCRCDVCKQEINWFHRYYYRCSHAPSCEYSIHKFCSELPLTLKHAEHSAHSLVLTCRWLSFACDICGRTFGNGDLFYECFECDFTIDVNCARIEHRIIHHPSHQHPLVAIIEPFLCKCNACGKEHKGSFYLCGTCFSFFVHTDCVFLSKTLLIQETTQDAFFHTHPLVLSYSFPKAEQKAKFNPLCRMCYKSFKDENLWIYKCEKCWYYAHLDCATSRKEPFMSIFSSIGGAKTFKNFQVSDYPQIVHLPFPDETHNILKHLFFKETLERDVGNVNHDNYHRHRLSLVGTSTGCNDISTPSCHNPMKKIELLCDGCLKPITSNPFYKCADENKSCSNFVLHEWCTRLPTRLQNHPLHPQHTLTFHSNARNKFYSVFVCIVCDLPCNGFVYTCDQCDYVVDVSCCFIPKNITHEVHPSHLLSRFETEHDRAFCELCLRKISLDTFTFACRTCDVYIHIECALLLPRKIQHKYDKHPMTLSYFPAENHKSEYFCEICEEEFDPERCFYHCDQCSQSIHSACAPLILRSEMAAYSYFKRSIYQFVNIKFGGIHKTKGHPHLLSFVQGIESDGRCSMCSQTLQYEMIFKCLQCGFAIDWKCCERIDNQLGSEQSESEVDD